MIAPCPSLTWWLCAVLVLPALLLYWQPALLRILPILVAPICARLFHRHYSGQLALLNRRYRGTSTLAPSSAIDMFCAPCWKATAGGSRFCRAHHFFETMFDAHYCVRDEGGSPYIGWWRFIRLGLGLIGHIHVRCRRCSRKKRQGTYDTLSL